MKFNAHIEHKLKTKLHKHKSIFKAIAAEEPDKVSSPFQSSYVESDKKLIYCLVFMSFSRA